jgi:hypothetical protein
MSTHLEKTILRMANALPTPVQIAGYLPQLPLLSLATQRDQVLFFGKYSTLLASRTFEDLQSLYKAYLEAPSVTYFLQHHKIDVTPKQFAEGLPYIVIRCDSICPKCAGRDYIARCANRSAFTYPDGFYVDYACINPKCGFMVRGNDPHFTTRNVAPRITTPPPAKPVPKSSPKNNDVQRYLLAVIDAYVPEIKANAIHDYAKGNIGLAQVEDMTGIKLTQQHPD